MPSASKLLVQLLMIALFLTPFMITAVAGLPYPEQEPLWSVPDQVFDLDFSKDGSLIVISTGDALKVYSSDGSLLWWYSKPSYTVTAVAVSCGGEAVAAAFYSVSNFDSRILYWSGASILSGSPEPMWNSTNLYGEIGAEALDISCSGEQVVAVGTGPNLYYWNESSSRSGGEQDATWHGFLGEDLVSVRISDDGDRLAILYHSIGRDGELALYWYEGALHASGPVDPTAFTRISLSNNVIDSALSMSGDGRYVVVSYNTLGGSGLAYIDFSVSPYKYWTSTFDFNSIGGVDVSDDGSIVATTVGMPLPALYYNLYNSGVEFLPAFIANISFYSVDPGFANGSTMIPDVNATIEFTNPEYLKSISMDSDGEVAVAGTGYTVIAATPSGEVLWYDNSTNRISDHVAVARWADLVATGGGEIDSLHLYRLMPRPPTLPIVGGSAVIEGPSLSMPAIIIGAIMLGLLILRRR